MTIEPIETVASGAGASAHSPDDAVSLDIAAQPDVLWRMVSDIRNMGRCSPETFSTRWLRGATGPVPGARFPAWTKWYMFFWATNSVIEVAEPGREFAFSTVVWGKKRPRWAYMFEPLSDGAGAPRARTLS